MSTANAQYDYGKLYCCSLISINLGVHINKQMTGGRSWTMGDWVLVATPHSLHQTV